MPTPTPELGLQKALDADDTADYLDTSLASSLTTLDSLFNNVSGHTHGGVHQGGPISSIPASAIPAGSITSAMLVDGSIQTVDIGDGQVTGAKIAAGAITSSLIADGTVQNADLAAGVAAANVGALGGILAGTLPNPSSNPSADVAWHNATLSGAVLATLTSQAMVQSADGQNRLVLVSGRTFAQTNSDYLLPGFAAPMGFVEIDNASSGLGCIVHCRGAAGAVDLVWQAGGTYSVNSPGHAGTTNIYWDGAKYCIENQTGSTSVYRCTARVMA